MARGKTRKAPISTGIILILSLIGVAITGLLGLFVIDLRDRNVLFFAEDVNSLTRTYEKLELSYIDAVQTVIQKKSPIAVEYLIELKASYTNIQNKLAPVQESNAKAELLQSLYERETDIEVLQSINSLMILQESIGAYVTKFSTCTQSISFGQEAKIIVEALKLCTQNLTEAQLLALQINESNLRTCKTDQKPAILINKMNDQHQALIEYYSAVAARNAKDATAADSKYRSLTSILSRTPGWNTCIALSISQQSDMLREN